MKIPGESTEHERDVGDAAGHPGSLGVPFESKLSFASFCLTLRGMLTAPRMLMTYLQQDRGLATATLFYLIVTLPATFLGQTLGHALTRTMGPVAPAPGVSPSTIMEVRAMLATRATLEKTLVAAIIGTLLGWLLIMLCALFVQGALRLMVGGGRGLQVTCKTLLYCATPMIFSTLPYIGVKIGFIWMLILQCLTIGPAHRVKGGTAVLTVIGYWVAMFLLVPALFVVIIVLYVMAKGAEGWT